MIGRMYHIVHYALTPLPLVNGPRGYVRITEFIPKTLGERVGNFMVFHSLEIPPVVVAPPPRHSGSGIIQRCDRSSKPASGNEIEYFDLSF